MIGGGGIRFTWSTSESVLLQHVSWKALAAVRAWCVDTSVVADVALMYQALIHVLHLNTTLHCILPILLLTDGKGLFRVPAVRYYRIWREGILFSQAIQLYDMHVVKRLVEPSVRLALKQIDIQMHKM